MSEDEADRRADDAYDKYHESAQWEYDHEEAEHLRLLEKKAEKARIQAAGQQFLRRAMASALALSAGTPPPEPRPGPQEQARRAAASASPSPSPRPPAGPARASGSSR